MKELLELFRDIHEIKHIERRGWKDIGVERPRDTVASHSYGAAMIGWIMAEKHDLDPEKIIKAMLVHDLIQAYIPDYTPEDEEFESKKEIEKREMDRLLEDIPVEIRQEAEDLLEDVQDEPKFSRVVKECDKIETILQAYLYSEEKGENHMEEFMDSYEEYFRTEIGREVFEQLEEMNRSLED
ncbi:MAG: HD family hydrolase [Candidatus Nanohaloarchaea archaeon]